MGTSHVIPPHYLPGIPICASGSETFLPVAEGSFSERGAEVPLVAYTGTQKNKLKRYTLQSLIVTHVLGILNCRVDLLSRGDALYVD